MSTLRHVMHVPLALLAGAALASNPRLFPDSQTSPTATVNVVERIRAQEAERSNVATSGEGRRGPESPELRALRLAEEQFFEEMYGDSHKEAAAPDDLGDPEQAEAGDGSWEGLNQPGIPIAKHAMVRRYVDFFSSNAKGREVFTSWLKRSGRYREIIGEALRRHGLPGDLEAVVFVESGFWPTAKSSAGAVGLWQFMPGTARAYGLTVTPTFDERRNPWRASDAAAQHLTDLHARLQSWDLVLAAYNYGYQNVESKMSKAEASDFWQLVDQGQGLPEETRKYVPKVQAVAMLLNNLDHFGFNQVTIDEPIRGVEFEVPPGTSLDLLIRAAGTSKTHFLQMNPEFLTRLVPDRGSPVTVHIPRSNLARARVMLPRLLGESVHEIEDAGAGDPGFDWGMDGGADSAQGRLQATIVSRAQREAMVKELAAGAVDKASVEKEPAAPSNHAIASVDASSCESTQAPLFTSDLMMSVIDGSVSSKSNESSAESVSVVGQQMPDSISAETAMALAFLSYRVSMGDSLSELAKRFGVTERELVLDNGIKNSSLIFKGQSLRIRDTNKTPERPHLTYQVKRGDSLSKIAARVKDSETELAKRNNITNPDHIRVGQVVLIPPT